MRKHNSEEVDQGIQENSEILKFINPINVLLIDIILRHNIIFNNIRVYKIDII